MTIDFDQPINRIGTDCEKWDTREQRFGRADVLPLWVADMDFAAPQSVVEALATRAAHPIYGYTQVNPDVYESLLSWLHRRFDWQISSTHVVLAPGVVPSIHAAILALTHVDDGVIVQSPVYAPFAGAVRQLGRRLLDNTLLAETDNNGQLCYRMDVDGLAQQCAQGAKLLLLCSPHNPVGRVWRQDELRTLLTVTRHYGVTVLADEIHADLIYPDCQHIPLATLAQTGDKIITAVAPSKTFNLPGMGLSALIIADAELREYMAAEFANWHWHAGNPFSLTAFSAAYLHGEAWLIELLNYLSGNRDAVMAAINRYWPGVAPVCPQGTVLMWLDCRKLGMNDIDLHAFFIQRCRIGLSPGIQFGAAGRGFMRLNLATRRELLIPAIEQAGPAFLNLR